MVFRDLGRISYKKAWDIQTELNAQLIDWKRNAEAGHAYQPHYLLFCEHDPVFTLGKTGSEGHLLSRDLKYRGQAIDFFRINRGGDITFHGPGQVVGYPIFDLDRIFTDVHRYIRSIEEVVIRTLRDYQLQGTRIDGYTGVWIADESGQYFRKVCAIGVHLSRWVTMHGFAFNVNTDLGFFDLIVPCGIQDQSMTITSMQRELNRKVDIQEVKDKLKFYFARVFDLEYHQEISEGN